LNQVLKQPEFYSTPSDFRVVLKNVNYFSNIDTAQDNQQDNQQVNVQEMILQYCSIPRRRKEIAQYCGYKDVRYFSSNFLNPLLESGRLQMTIPDKPKSRNQKYIAVQ
jgi:ATP-dependent DNA helicase RecG